MDIIPPQFELPSRRFSSLNRKLHKNENIGHTIRTSTENSQDGTIKRRISVGISVTTPIYSTKRLRQHLLQALDTAKANIEALALGFGHDDTNKVDTGCVDWVKENGVWMQKMRFEKTVPSDTRTPWRSDMEDFGQAAPLVQAGFLFAPTTSMIDADRDIEMQMAVPEPPETVPCAEMGAQKYHASCDSTVSDEDFDAVQ